MTVSAVAAVEINVSRLRASSAVLLGMTSCERVKLVFRHIISLHGNSVRNAMCFIDIAKICIGNLAHLYFCQESSPVVG